MIFTVVVIASCRRQPPQHVWILDHDELEMLNGNVKQVTIGEISSRKDANYDIVKFDESGDLRYSEKRYLDVPIMEKRLIRPL